MFYSSNPTVVDSVMISKIRSLLIYNYTPLVGAGYVNIEEISKIEDKLRRLAFNTSRDISNKIVRNITEIRDL